MRSGSQPDSDKDEKPAAAALADAETEPEPARARSKATCPNCDGKVDVYKGDNPHKQSTGWCKECGRVQLN